MNVELIKKFVQLGIEHQRLLLKDSPIESKEAFDAGNEIKLVSDEIDNLEFMNNPLDEEGKPYKEALPLWTLENDICFARSDPEDDSKWILLVLCNDLFYWASADCEPITENELPLLFEMEKSHPRGAEKWCCLKRHMRPQKPIEEMWKAKGWWDEDLESLPTREK